MDMDKVTLVKLAKSFAEIEHGRERVAVVIMSEKQYEDLHSDAKIVEDSWTLIWDARVIFSSVANPKLIGERGTAITCNL